jgi:hypothetical protein
MHEVLHSSSLAAAQNGWIGLSYVFASFAVFLFTFRWGPDAARWIGRSALFYLTTISAMAFLLGCGLHHLHLAGEVLRGGAHSQMQHEAIFWNWMQVVGAPGFVALSWWLYVVISRRLARMQNAGR